MLLTSASVRSPSGTTPGWEKINGIRTASSKKVCFSQIPFL